VLLALCAASFGSYVFQDSYFNVPINIRSFITVRLRMRNEKMQDCCHCRYDLLVPHATAENCSAVVSFADIRRDIFSG
jgi:hypothetical protein